MMKQLTHRLSTWRLRTITRRRLAQMDDRLLADIGTERDCIAEFVASQPE